MWGGQFLWSAVGLLAVLLIAGAIWASRQSGRADRRVERSDPTGRDRGEPAHDETDVPAGPPREATG